MNIVVCIKQVPETNAVRMDPETGTMVRDGVEAIVNPLDLYAIELAILLREQYGGEITAVTMGPPKAEKALKEAISMGVDNGVLVSDKAFAGADTWSTSYVLAEAIKQHVGEYDLLLFGERATDGDTGQVGPGISAFLDVPVASYVSKVESVSDGVCRCRRLIEEGYEILDVQTPCALTVVKEISDPRLPTLRGKQRAKAMDLPVLTTQVMTVDAESLGLKGSPTRVVKIFHPQVTREVEMLTADDEASVNAACDRVVEYLKEKQII